MDPYVVTRTVYPTHHTALLGRIIRIRSDMAGTAEPVMRTALVQEYCHSAFSTCINSCHPSRINYSALRFIIFYMGTATTEICDLTNTEVTVLH